MGNQPPDIDHFGRMTERFRHLWVVCAVARHGSINGAAQNLSLSQPAISRAIRLLEEGLGVMLFDRRSAGVTPTAFGRIFLRRVERAMRYLMDGERALAGRRPEAPATTPRSPIYRFLSYRHLHSSVVLAECRNMTIAADRLGVTQPAVHRSLRELEHIVGQHLFERHYRRMVPTEGCELLHRFFSLSLAELRHCASELLEQQGTISGRVKIGILPLLQTVIVPQAIAALSSQHRGLQFTIVDGSYEYLLAALRSGELELMVGALRSPPPLDDVIEAPLFEDELSIVARGNHPLRRLPKLGMKELAAAGWVVPPKGTLIRDYFERMFARRRIALPNDLIEASSLAAIRALLLESERLTIISRERIRYEENNGHLTALPIRLRDTRRTIGITTRADALHPPGATAFLHHLRSFSQNHTVFGQPSATGSKGAAWPRVKPRAA